MMNKYELLISGVGEALKSVGFKKSGQSFFCYKENNIGLIGFQKSQKSSSTYILFTINLGVYTSSLKVFDLFDIKSKPSISDCHWRERIGFLLPEKKDYWWEIIDKTDISALTSEIVDRLRGLAIPEIEKNISDDSLEQSWMEGRSAGLTTQQMYLYLIALLKIKKKPGVEEKIAELLDYSKGKPFYQNVKDHLAKLGI